LKVGFAVDDKRFRIRYPRYEHCRLLPTSTDSLATIITTTIEDDDEWIINDRQEGLKRDPSVTNAAHNSKNINDINDDDVAKCYIVNSTIEIF